MHNDELDNNRHATFKPVPTQAPFTMPAFREDPAEPLLEQGTELYDLQRPQRQTAAELEAYNKKTAKTKKWTTIGHGVAIAIAICWGIINAVSVASVTGFWLPIALISLSGLGVNLFVYWQEVATTFVEIFVTKLTKGLTPKKKAVLGLFFFLGIVGGIANGGLFLDFAISGAATLALSTGAGIITAIAWPVAILFASIMFISVIALTVGTVSKFLRERQYLGIGNFFKSFFIRRFKDKRLNEQLRAARHERARSKELERLSEAVSNAKTPEEKARAKAALKQKQAELAAAVKRLEAQLYNNSDNERISVLQHVFEAGMKGVFLVGGLVALGISSLTLFGTMTNSFQSLLLKIPGAAEGAVKVAGYVMVMGLAQVADLPYTIRQVAVLMTKFGRLLGKGGYKFGKFVLQNNKKDRVKRHIGSRVDAIKAQAHEPKGKRKLAGKVGLGVGASVALISNALGMGFTAKDGSEYLQQMSKGTMKSGVADGLAIGTNTLESFSFGSVSMFDNYKDWKASKNAPAAVPNYGAIGRTDESAPVSASSPVTGLSSGTTSTE